MATDRPACTCRPYHVYFCPAYGEDNRVKDPAAVTVEAPTTKAARLAADIARRVESGEPSSVYRIARDVLCDDFRVQPHHDTADALETLTNATQAHG